MSRKMVYISGSLMGRGNRAELKNFYESMAEICRAREMEAYLPHQHTDPVDHPWYTDKEVYQINSKAVENSQMVIAYVGIPSLGVGAEIEKANSLRIPVVLLHERGTHMSRHIRGMPNILEEVEFSDIQDCLEKLGETLLREGCE